MCPLTRTILDHYSSESSFLKYLPLIKDNSPNTFVYTAATTTYLSWKVLFAGGSYIYLPLYNHIRIVRGNSFLSRLSFVMHSYPIIRGEIEIRFL